MTPNNVTVDNNYYEMAHGKSPRGRGGWAFGPEKCTSVDSPLMFWAPSGTFQEAKKAAKAHFAAMNVDYIYTQS